MKIVDQRGTQTRFDDIDVGDYFYVHRAGEEVPANLFRKVPLVENGKGASFNAINLLSAKFSCFSQMSLVQPVEIEVVVLRNTQKRSS